MNRAWWREPGIVAPLLLLAGLTILALAAPLFSATPADLGNIAERRFVAPLGRTPDGAMHILGTDRFGRDLLQRLLLGARISLAVGVLAALIALAVGATLGAVAGYAGGWTDRIVVALTDVALAVPRIPLLLLIAATAPPGIGVTILAIGLTGWMTVARLIRADVRAMRLRDHVEAARALGAGPPRLLLRHVLPHAMAPALVATALGTGAAIQIEAGLSFLGLGVQPPTASWGNLIAAGRDALVIAPWVALAPALAVVAVVLACSLIADALEARPGRL